jgi:hypothetical protein
MVTEKLEYELSSYYYIHRELPDLIVMGQEIYNTLVSENNSWLWTHNIGNDLYRGIVVLTDSINTIRFYEMTLSCRVDKEVK